MYMNDINIDNQKIASFLGWQRQNTEFIIPAELYFPSTVREFESGYFDYTMEFYDLQFHCNWNWLMLVIDKIESLTFDTKYPIYWIEISYSFITMHSHPQYNGKVFDKEIQVQNTKLQAVYNLVIDFIDWFNKEYQNI